MKPDDDLLMMGLRFYDPELGIFLQKDPFQGYIEDPTMLHPYMYTRNDPVNRIDPTGESWFGNIVEGGKAVYNNYVKPAARWVNENIVQPVAEAVDTYVVQPGKKYIVDPAVKGFNDYVAEPLKSGYRQVKRGIAVRAEKARQKVNKYISRGKAVGTDLKEKAVRALDSKPGRMVMAGLQTAGGVAMTAAGGAVAATTGWTGVGAVLGGAMIAHGVNDIVSGGANLYFGATNQMNRMGSVNPLQEILYKPVFGEYADTAYMITSLGLGVGGGAASGMSKLATAAQLSGRASNEAKIVSRMKYFLADETGSVKLGGWGKGKADNAVIGKMVDLNKPGVIRPGEYKVADLLPDLGNPKANWKQNSSVLRQIMNEGKPIRDVSIDPKTGALINNTGFLRAERDLLTNKEWTYNPGTGYWDPPTK